MARILHMDDDHAVRTLVASMLETDGRHVVGVENGERAVAEFERALSNKDAFDAVLLDLNVPGGMGGRETIARLLVLDPHVRAILVSGSSTDPDFLDHARLGFCSALAKPFFEEDLLQALRCATQRVSCDDPRCGLRNVC